MDILEAVRDIIIKWVTASCIFLVAAKKRRSIILDKFMHI